MKRVLSVLLLLLAAVSIPGNELNWKRIGPSAGDVQRIVPDRNNPNIWYLIENQFSRLYRSTDNGETWKYTGHSKVINLLVHSASSEVFIVLPGRDYYKYSLFSSRDFGRTFQLRSANAPRLIFDHPSDPKILWGSGASNPYELSLSTDAGAHWKGFNNLPYKFDKKYEIDGWELNPSYYYLSSILVSPFDSKTIYVSTEVEFDIGCSAEAIDIELATNNFGKTWAYAEYPSTRYLYDKAFPERAFSVNNSEVRILTERGWKSISAKKFDDVVSVPGKPDQLFGLFRGKQWFSRDEGANWRNVDIGPAGKADVLKARTFPEGSLLAGTSGGGVYVIDSRWNWSPASGLHEATVREVSTAPGSKIVYAVTSEESFLYRSLNAGQSWENITDNIRILNQPSSTLHLKVNQKDARHVFAIVNNKIFLSFDAGKTWANLSQQQLTRAFFAPDSQTVHFSRPGYGHLYRSTDGGRTIQELPQEYGQQKNTIFDIAIDSFNGYLYAATNRGLFVYRGDGRKPEQIATELSPECLYCLSFYKIQALPMRGQFIASAENVFYKTVNQGVTWKKLISSDGKIMVADNKGIHLYLVDGRLRESNDGGFTWNNISASVHPRLGNSSYDQAIWDMTDPHYRPVYVATTLGIFEAE